VSIGIRLSLLLYFLLSSSPKVLGKVACRVLSALLGIGVAERAWGAVKHLKSGKRAHLGAEATRMQATIFGAACIEKSRTLKAEKEQSMELWNDNDLEFQLGLENFAADEASGVVPPRTNPRRLFHAWIEEWEEVSSKSNNLVHEARLLRKYAGLKWLDPDSDKMYVADSDNLEWKRGLGWCAIGIREGDGDLESWQLKLLPSLIKKTPQESVLNVEFIHLSAAERAQRKAKRKAARELNKANNRTAGRKRSRKRKRRVVSDSGSESDYSSGDEE
jgi:hypothetical protein